MSFHCEILINTMYLVISNAIALESKAVQGICHNVPRVAHGPLGRWLGQHHTRRAGHIQDTALALTNTLILGGFF